MGFFSSPGGGYLVQSVFHSFVIALVVEVLLRIWGPCKPQTELKFRLLILALPVLGWPFYQLIHPARGGQEFRASLALLDLNQWLAIELGGIFPVWGFLVLLMVLAGALFLAQEVVPALQHRRHSHHPREAIPPGRFPKLDRALARAAMATGCPSPRALFLNLSEPSVYATGVSRPCLVLTPALIESLDEEELEAVLAHEMAHLKRGDNQVGWVLLALRTLMFYNPVVLLAFRRITQDGEKACDDLAAAATGKPLALASGLIKVFRGAEPGLMLQQGRGWLRSWAEAVDSRAHRVQAEDRIARLVHPLSYRDLPYENLRLAFTAAALAALLYFVV